jgi:ribonuclease HII
VIPHEIWVDGNQTPRVPMRCKTIVGGDALHDCISAASILAKVHRDALLVALDAQHPAFGFAKHKGYGTAQHLTALTQHAPVGGVHRRSFAPVQIAVQKHARLF